MSKKNTAIGLVLVFLGISMYLRNYNIGTGSLLTLFLGLGLFYAYYIKKEQPFAIFGGIFTAIGLMYVLHDIRLFRIDMTFETLLIVLGIIFMFIFYSKHAQGFVFPGMILPAIGIYLILLRTFNDKYTASSIFLLLGFAFYAIYFIAYMGSSGWPLIPATIFLLTGILAYAFSFKVITWNMVYMSRGYLWPSMMILAGVLILMNLRKRRS
ncbi:MAG: hypothetical protein APF77_20160 [Clostridia bacterium BRH_c25]|nr:MAG: hypothetical protein APF77_02620 [Clostridia bacterium BRH_c25]KUO76332.1 MAG: hypothetical protein APF77_20160 [Clostridia bacterium BRH_c25]